jgi:hypothetical protein
VLEGTVRDAATGEGLPYAQLVVEGRGTGTVSNGEGAFRLLLPEAFAGDTLVVRYVGYATERLAVRRAEAMVPLEIRLRASAVLLRAVVVRAGAAEELVAEAVRRIPANHDARPFRYTGFYRLVSRERDTVIQLSEAVFDIYRPGFDRKGRPAGEGQFRLRRQRGERYEGTFRGSAQVMFGMRPQGVMAYDVVRDADGSDLFGRKGLRDHVWTIDGITTLQDRPVWRVAFDQAPDVKRALYRGVLYLDTASLSFVGLDAAISPRGLRYHRVGTLPERLLMESMGLSITTTYDSLHIRYRDVGGHHYMAEMLLVDRNTIRNERERYLVRVASEVRYVTTAIDTVAEPFPYEQRLDAGTFLETTASPVDPAFWEGWNVVPWESDYAAEAAAIRRRNAALE